jgi:hypothetical protein
MCPHLALLAQMLLCISLKGGCKSFIKYQSSEEFLCVHVGERSERKPRPSEPTPLPLPVLCRTPNTRFQSVQSASGGGTNYDLHPEWAKNEISLQQ